MSAPPVILDEALTSWLAEHGEDLIALRRHLHAHPELSGQEFATTELVAERLRLAGLEPRLMSTGTGCVCDLADPGDDRPRLAVRADLDALAMNDETQTHYRSQVDGVSHACGHDVHTTVGVGVGLFLAHHRHLLSGPVRLIFQPAEERVPGGAVDAIAEGALEGVGAIVGLHCEPKLDAGQIGVRRGPISSAADMATITLTGPGGHTARPELTVDMISVAGRLVSELPGRVADLVGEPAAVKLVFGHIGAGDAANVIPSRCVMRAAIRTPVAEVWETLPALVERALADLVAPTGAGWHLDYVHGVPPVVNDAAVTDLVRSVAGAQRGEDAVIDAVQSWGGDDFAWYLRRVPGSYVRLGTHNSAGPGPRLDLHAGSFDVDEAAIGIGVRLLVGVADAFHRQFGDS